MDTATGRAELQLRLMLLGISDELFEVVDRQVFARDQHKGHFGDQNDGREITYTWNAIFLPKGAPESFVKTLHDAALAAMHTRRSLERTLQQTSMAVTGPHLDGD
jgi:hypothetical protein